MLNIVVAGLSRLLPRPPEREAVEPSLGTDCGWFESSFDLLRGLDVVEFDSAAQVFAKTLPAVHAPRQA